MNEQEYKLKHWWWIIFPPSDYLVDELILRISRSNDKNKKITRKLAKKFVEKYYRPVKQHKLSEINQAYHKGYYEGLQIKTKPGKL